jgi:hypothetical protein
MAQRTSIRALNKGESRKYCEFALQQHGKAIKLMRKTLSNEEQHLRKAVLACLLVFCFEGFSGNQGVAIAHAQSGYKLLQAQTRKDGAKGIEYDLIRIFSRIDLSAMTTADSRSIEYHNVQKNEDTEIVDSMPTVFSDFDEAHKCWDVIMRRSTHFIHTVAAIS